MSFKCRLNTYIFICVSGQPKNLSFWNAGFEYPYLQDTHLNRDSYGLRAMINYFKQAFRIAINDCYSINNGNI